jgi:4'-phosphopantetheinyl transferase
MLAIPSHEGPSSSLAATDVHVWLTFPGDIDDGMAAEYRVSLSDEQERTAESEFLFERDRHRYLVTRALVRTALSWYAPVAPSAWRFGVSAYGRPYALNGGPQFNVSHTDGLIVVAVTRDAAVGVDVEHVHRRVDVLDIARRNFSAREHAELLATPHAEQRERFFSYWTLKEAYCKCQGEGIALLGSVSFALPGDEPVVRCEGAAVCAGLRFRLLRPSPQHVAAICCGVDDPTLTVIRARPLHSAVAERCAAVRGSEPRVLVAS